MPVAAKKTSSPAPACRHHDLQGRCPLLNGGFFRRTGDRGGQHGAPAPLMAQPPTRLQACAAGSHHDVDFWNVDPRDIGHRRRRRQACWMRAPTPDFLNELLMAGFIATRPASNVVSLPSALAMRRRLTWTGASRSMTCHGRLVADNQLLHVEAGAGLCHAARAGSPTTARRWDVHMSRLVPDGVHGDISGRPGPIAHADFRCQSMGASSFSPSPRRLCPRWAGELKDRRRRPRRRRSGVFIAAPEPARGCQSGGFGDTDKIKVQARRFHKGHIALQKI